MVGPHCGIGKGRRPGVTHPHSPFLASVPVSTRPERYDDPWRYDPRFTGSFDDDPEPHRDPYGEEVDRRSVHSERSAQSLRSSFSSHSHQSQIYRNHSMTAVPYEAPHPPGSLPGQYAYGAYGSNFGSAQGFPEYGYPAEAGWPTAEQGVCVWLGPCALVGTKGCRGTLLGQPPKPRVTEGVDFSSHGNRQWPGLVFSAEYGLL